MLLKKLYLSLPRVLIKRYDDNPDKPLDIILAENMRSAADFTREQLIRNLPAGFPVESYVGLIETSIGKMVPIMPLAEAEKDPLMVFAEPYNTLILDGKGFKSPIPDVKGLAPKNNIKAWVDRKAFIHNLGHATAAYYGYFHHPDAVYMYEVLEDEKFLEFTRDVMIQSAEILKQVYPDDFTMLILRNILMICYIGSGIKHCRILFSVSVRICQGSLVPMTALWDQYTLQKLTICHTI